MDATTFSGKLEIIAQAADESWVNMPQEISTLLTMALILGFLFPLFFLVLEMGCDSLDKRRIGDKKNLRRLIEAEDMIIDHLRWMVEVVSNPLDLNEEIHAHTLLRDMLIRTAYKRRPFKRLYMKFKRKLIKEAAANE